MYTCIKNLQVTRIHFQEFCCEKYLIWNHSYLHRNLRHVLCRWGCRLMLRVRWRGITIMLIITLLPLSEAKREKWKKNWVLTNETWSIHLPVQVHDFHNLYLLLWWFRKKRSTSGVWRSRTWIWIRIQRVVAFIFRRRLFCFLLCSFLFILCFLYLLYRLQRYLHHLLFFLFPFPVLFFHLFPDIFIFQLTFTHLLTNKWKKLTSIWNMDVGLSKYMLSFFQKLNFRIFPTPRTWFYMKTYIYVLCYG